MADEVETMQYIGRHPFPIASWPLERRKSENYNTDIRDIRQERNSLDLATALRSGLHNPDENGQRSFPEVLLSNGPGWRHFEETTQSPEANLKDAESDLLQAHGTDLAAVIAAGTILLELGAGDIRKTTFLLEAIESQHKIVDYYALNLSKDELESFLQEMNPGRFKYISCHGLVGTQVDARAWATQYENKQRPISVLSMGSRFDGMTRTGASEFWKEWSNALRKNADKRDCHIIIGIDSCKDGERISKKYNDAEGRNVGLILSVLNSANQQLDDRVFDREDWTQQSEWESEAGRYALYLVPNGDIDFEGTTLKKDEKVLVAHSHRYDDAEKQRVWQDSQLEELRRYSNADESYGLHVLSLRQHNM